MEKRKIGTLDVSIIGIGCNSFGRRTDAAGVVNIVNEALDLGINFFDTADVYGETKSEELLGTALRGRRDEAIIASKFGGKLDNEEFRTRPEYVHKAADASLRRLGVERIDLYQLHWPDPKTPIADTLGALAELVAAGKVREIGCSNLSLEQLREAADAVGTGQPAFVSIQNEYNILNRSAELDVIPECRATGVAFIPYVPLAAGLLTGKYRRGEPLPSGTRLSTAREERRAAVLTERNYDLVDELTAFADKSGHTLLDLAFARLLAEPAIPSVIAGANSPAQVRANAATAGWALSDADVDAVNKIAPIE